MEIKLKQIRLHQLKMQLNNPFTTSFGTVQDKEFYIIEAIDDKGNRGYGEAVAFTSPWYTEETQGTTLHMIEDFFVPLLQEHKLGHPNDVTTIFSSIKRNNMAKASVEGAIWDLYAKIQQKPLAKLLGGTKEEVEIGISIGIQPTISELIRKIEYYVELGYKRVKLKIKPGQDISVIREVRKKFPNLLIMADANSSYSLNDIELLKSLDEFDLMMIEQPLAHDDIVDHAQLQRAIRTPICLDESINSLDDTRKAIELGSCRVINIKPARVGGLTEAVHIHNYCFEKGIDVWCGGMLEAGIGRAQCIALSSLPGFTMPGDTAGSSHYWKKDIITPEVILEQGKISVPNKPGLGFDINWNVLEEYRIGMKTYNI